VNNEEWLLLQMPGVRVFLACGMWGRGTPGGNSFVCLCTYLCSCATALSRRGHAMPL